MNFSASSRLRAFKQTAPTDPFQLVAVVLVLLACGALVAFPIAMLVAHSFVDDSGHLGIAAFAQLLMDKSLIAAALNSLFFMVYVAAGCLAVGVPLAWLVARTDVPAKPCLRAGIAVAFIIPSFINVIAWIYLTAPNSGTLNKLLVAWLGLAAPPFNIFSFGGLVFIETAHLFPIVFFAVAAALANIDASHEQAARMLGAGRWHTTRTITLPLVAPAIISSATLCMLDALSSFGAPAAIGTTANFSVLSTAIYGLLTYPPRVAGAAPRSRCRSRCSRLSAFGCNSAISDGTTSSP